MDHGTEISTATKADFIIEEQAIRAYDLHSDPDFIPIETDFLETKRTVAEKKNKLRELEAELDHPRKKRRIESHDDLEDNSESDVEAIRMVEDVSISPKKQIRVLKESIWDLEKELPQKKLRYKAFCARRRGEFVVDELKSQFREGLQELDETSGFSSFQDRENIDVPVFTTSAINFTKLKEFAKSGWEADLTDMAFDQLSDTGISALHDHCRDLATSLRRHSLHSFFRLLSSLVQSITTYLEQMEQASDDTANLRRLWAVSDDDVELPDSNKNPIIHKLTEDFGTVVEDILVDLQERFREQLESKCDLAVVKAADNTSSVYETFVNKMRWNTHHATMRRDGEFHGSLNDEFSRPFTRNLVKVWSAVLQLNGLKSLSDNIQRVVQSLINEIIQSAPPGLKDRIEVHGNRCLEFVEKEVAGTIDETEIKLAKRGKDLSRFFAPRIRSGFTQGYQAAVNVAAGAGFYNRQKEVFLTVLKKEKETPAIFKTVSEDFKKSLAEFASAMRQILLKSLAKVAQRVQVNLSALWDGKDRDLNQIRARQRLKLQLETMASNLRQLEHDGDGDVVMR